MPCDRMHVAQLVGQVLVMLLYVTIKSVVLTDCFRETRLTLLIRRSKACITVMTIVIHKLVLLVLMLSDRATPPAWCVT